MMMARTLTKFSWWLQHLLNLVYRFSGSLASLDQWGIWNIWILPNKLHQIQIESSLDAWKVNKTWTDFTSQGLSHQLFFQIFIYHSKALIKSRFMSLLPHLQQAYIIVKASRLSIILHSMWLWLRTLHLIECQLSYIRTRLMLPIISFLEKSFGNKISWHISNLWE